MLPTGKPFQIRCGYGLLGRTLSGVGDPIDGLGPLDDMDLSGIDWVIVGGESGPKARPMRPEWVTSIREQCRLAGSAFFFKQWGGVFKSKTGRKLDGRTWDEMPGASAKTSDLHVSAL